jgi:hypothetical protein
MVPRDYIDVGDPIVQLMRSRPRARIGCRGPDQCGAHARIRTGDLFLTKEMLYRLSYVGGAAASEF